MAVAVVPSGKKATVKKAARVKKIATNANSSYDAFKSFNGQHYTGMQIGKSHKWYYDKGEWKERKITPDRWELTYSVIKRRAGKAPEGSGVPVGTGYHWFILAHQFVHKINADDYTTAMTGIKLKLAHKRADKDKWNISEAAKRKQLIKMLEAFVKELKGDETKTKVVDLEFDFKNKSYKGYAVPMFDSCKGGVCNELDVTLNDKHYGIIRCTDKGWRMTNIKPQSFVNAIGEEITLWYE